MSVMGWQRALLWASLPAIGLILVWGWYGRNSPREHRSVSPEELAEIGSAPTAAVDGTSAHVVAAGAPPGAANASIDAASAPVATAGAANAPVHADSAPVAAAGAPVAAEAPVAAGAAGAPVDATISLRQLLNILTDRNVLLLAISYLCMNYSFYLLSNWVFLYLVQERKFSVLESGWLASSPPLAAAVGAGVGGLLTGTLCLKFGNRWGYRLLPLCALPAAGVLLLLSVGASNPYWAVVGLALCFAAVELNEGAYWGAAMTLGRGDTMAVSGVMNTGGNLGGIIGIPIIAYLSEKHLWSAAFAIGAGFAVASAVLWLAIAVDQPAADT
jgi:predicted MFS family arabinose efflux permease